MYVSDQELIGHSSAKVFRISELNIVHILFTRVVTQVVGVGLAVNPACDAHKVSHKTGDAALEDNIIAEHDILVVSLRVVRLGHR